jgi:type VI secretion system protein ImpB
MAESTHDKLNRVRKPRVHITYQVQIGDAIEKREIPFVVGVMADLSGDRDPKKPVAKVKDRKFTQIDRDVFDTVMEKIEPRLTLSVKNTLANDDSNMSSELRFKKLADFSPENVVNQVPALKELLDARNKLSNLRSSLYGNDKLEELLNDVIKQTSGDGKGKEE